MDAQGAASVGERRVRRGLSYWLIVFGALSIFFGVLWIWPFSSGFQSTYINVVPVAPSPGESCQGVVVPFPYQGSCPPNYDPLPAPLDSLPLLPAIFLAVGGGALVLGLVPWARGRTLLLLLTIGLVATYLTSNIGSFGNQGWPINWFLYPISHPPGSNYFPVYIVVPAFLADWAIFSVAAGIVWILARRGLLTPSKGTDHIGVQ
jgi:hypothetical protein